MDDIQYQINSLQQRMNVIEHNFTVIADALSDHKVNTTIHVSNSRQIDCNLSQIEDDMVTIKLRLSKMASQP
jgi:hypothetical protein